MRGRDGWLPPKEVAAIDSLEEATMTDALALAVRTDRMSLTRSVRRADGTSEAGVLVTDVFTGAGVNGVAALGADPIRLARSHVENGAVNGDKISTVSQAAANFVSIGCDASAAKKAPRASRRNVLKTERNRLTPAPA
jgi:hypothetical protein